MLRPLVLALLLVSGLTPALAEVQREVPQSQGQVLLSYAPVVKRAVPAVVNVYASRVEKRPANPLFDDPIFRQFFGGGQPSSRVSQSLGSGVIVDPSGLVVTNHHVIAGMTDVKVALADHREYEAEIVLNDARTDLAVLRIKGGQGNFPVLQMGDSDALQVGDIALAIGDPFGVGQTVTQGIVSAVARTQIGISDFGFYIQTDAAINPGNSGGALIDMNARLIGINSAIYSKSGGSIGIGFAIPVNMVKVVVAAAKSGHKQLERPWLGANFQAVSRDIADSLNMDRPTGALVSDVFASSPAATAGLKRGDVVLAVNSQPVDDPEALGYRLATHPIGETVHLGVQRDGKKLDLALKLVAAPETPSRDPVTLSGRNPFAGATVWNISPAVADELSMASVPHGVVVAGVEDGSTAADVGLQKGDIVLAVNNEKITDTATLRRAVSGAHEYWKLSIGRGGQVLTSVIGG